MPRDILVLKENTKGEDYFIGDLHGGASQLKLVLGKLTENDRLFLVGDLADRGADSLGVYQTIMRANQERKEAGLPIQIHITRGNHEDMLLDFYKVKNDPSQPAYQNFMRNGGEWAAKLAPEKLKEIVDFISTLPYIIHGEGSKPYNIVHADTPFNDAELQARIKSGNLSLTQEEKEYATWARVDGIVLIKETKRTPDAVITYCGHTIGGGVRPETNHVNLDIETFDLHLVALVAHHKASCKLEGEIKSQNAVFPNGKSVKSIQEEISSQLSLYHQKVSTKLISEILKSQSLSAKNKAEKIDVVLTDMTGYNHRESCRPLKDCQEIYMKSLNAIKHLLDDGTKQALSRWIGNNTFHLLRFKEKAANDRAFSFFSHPEIRAGKSAVSEAIVLLGFKPEQVVKTRGLGK